MRGKSSRVFLVGLFLFLALCSVTYSQDPAGMTTEEILQELLNITERQAARLTELENILNEQATELTQLRQELTASEESQQRLQTIIDEQRTYSVSLEAEVSRLTRRARILTWTLAGSVAAAIVGWIM